MKEKFAKLVNVKSIVTLAMTGCMVGLLFTGIQPDKELLMLFSTSFGAVIAYFFNRKGVE